MKSHSVPRPANHFDSPVLAAFHGGGLAGAQLDGADATANSALPSRGEGALLSSSVNRNSTLPWKTCARLAPDLSTSTPNSVPRSVTTAVGVRTETGEGDF